MNECLYRFIVHVMDLSSAIPWTLGGGGGGDFVKFPLESANFPLSEGDIEQSKLANLEIHHRLSEIGKINISFCLLFRKVSLFETEFDLTEFIHGTCRCLLKVIIN